MVTIELLTRAVVQLTQSVSDLQADIAVLQEMSHLHDRGTTPLPGQEPLFDGTGSEL